MLRAARTLVFGAALSVQAGCYDIVEGVDGYGTTGTYGEVTYDGYDPGSTPDYGSHYNEDTSADMWLEEDYWVDDGFWLADGEWYYDEYADEWCYYDAYYDAWYCEDGYYYEDGYDEGWYYDEYTGAWCYYDVYYDEWYCEDGYGWP